MTSKARPNFKLAAERQVGDFNEAFTGPLVDQAGNLVLYEIRMNEVEFEAITKGGYNTGTPVPADFTFPVNDSEAAPDGIGTNGAMEVKGAWRELSDDEWASGAYIQQQALFYHSGDATQPASCEAVKVGLVGFHISHKIHNLSQESASGEAEYQWVWSTFEHKNNVPAVGAGETDATGDLYSFYDSACSPSVTEAICAGLDSSQPHPEEAYRCCPNLWRYDKIGPGGDPLDMPRTADQITRIDALGDGSGCSPIFHAAFGESSHGSVYENYVLVGTQWQGPAYEGAPFELRPAVLRNTTLESYFVDWKGGQQVNTSSCEGCHTSGIDHSFVFDFAKP